MMLTIDKVRRGQVHYESKRKSASKRLKNLKSLTSQDRDDQ